MPASKLGKIISICNHDNSDSVVTMVKRSVVLVNADANTIAPQILQSISNEKKYQRSKARFL